MDPRQAIDSLMLPLARCYWRYRNAAETRESHDAAYYLFEVFIKYTAASAIAEYLVGVDRDHKVNAALKGLARPSMDLGGLRSEQGDSGPGGTPRA